MTLQSWDNEGKLIAYRTPKGRRFYTHKQYEDYMGISKNKVGKVVLYARVSNRGQQEDLKNQTSFFR